MFACARRAVLVCLGLVICGFCWLGFYRFVVCVICLCGLTLRGLGGFSAFSVFLWFEFVVIFRCFVFEWLYVW